MARTSLDDYVLKAFEFYERIGGLDEPDDIKHAICEALRDLGFDYVTCADVPHAARDPLDGVLLNSRPEAYVTRYVEQNYTEIDPVVTELRRTLKTYSWSDVRQRRVLTKRQLSVMDEAREFEVTDGLIVPIVTNSGTLSIFSPCGRDPDLSPRARAAIELIGMAGHQALKRARIRERRAKNEGARLTDREREVVQWLSIGKTNYEIGEILGISAGTVGVHIDHVRRKFDASSRALIVVEALRRGEISI